MNQMSLILEVAMVRQEQQANRERMYQVQLKEYVSNMWAHHRYHCSINTAAVSTVRLQLTSSAAEYHSSGDSISPATVGNIVVSPLKSPPACIRCVWKV